MLHRSFALVLVFGLVPAAAVGAADWPMWRYDANRSAASPQELPPRLHLHWTRTFPALKPAWPDQSMMPFDANYEPVVSGTTLLVGSNRTDTLLALDTRTGHEKWRFHANGPIRFAPAVAAGRVYLACDDGNLYCLDAAAGSLHWKFRGGPNDRRILGNERLISMWPARGGPVVADGIVYFASGIWPFMGIFIHALDAESGKVLWTNDSDGSIYIKQPHNADSFAGVAPQGPLAIHGDFLLVPGGRSVPACYDRKTGKLVHFLLNENSKKGGGHEVAAIGSVFFNGGYGFLARTGKNLGPTVVKPVLTEEAVYGFEKDAIRALDLKKAELTSPKWKIANTGSFDFKGGTALIKAGTRLYAGAPGKLVSATLPLPNTGWPDVTWEATLPDTPASLVAADDRLFVVTLEGRLLCFGKDECDPLVHPRERPQSIRDE